MSAFNHPPINHTTITCFDVDRISENTLDDSDKHPKDCFMKLWAGNMVGMFLFFLLSFRFFALGMFGVFAFYMMSLIRVYMGWRSYRYSRVKFILMSLCTMAGSFAAAKVFHYVLGMMIL
ncbi:MAG: hypothetical protein K6F75_06740 [Butyrivibrio sp.]|nr:hypothetical protein [Butyrivibrio sp.]